MVKDKILYYSLVISCLTHGMVVFFPQNFKFFPRKEAPFKEIHVNYYILDQKAIKPPEMSVRKQAQEKKEEKEQLKVTPVEKGVKLEKISAVKESEQQKEKSLDLKNIVLPDLPQNFPNRQQFLNYYQIVRERIKIFAYRNRVGESVGEVFLQFKLSDNGILLESQVIDRQSNASEFLKRIALKSVRDASPFPEFPEEIPVSELKFATIIEFKIEK